MSGAALGSGFEPIPVSFPPTWLCRDLRHNPPTMISIPAGQRYRHVCPSCKVLSYLYHSPVALATIEHHPV